MRSPEDTPHQLDSYSALSAEQKAKGRRLDGIDYSIMPDRGDPAHSPTWAGLLFAPIPSRPISRIASDTEQMLDYHAPMKPNASSTHPQWSHLLLMLLALCLAGCESYPMGMSKDEWQMLSPEQRAQATREQAAIDAENRRIQAEEDALRRQAAADEAARQQERIDRLYRHARYGDIVSVNLEGGTLRFDGNDRAYEPVAFDLVRGEARTIVIHREEKRKYTVDVVVRLSEDGRTLYFDDASSKPLRLIEKTWDRGQTYEVELHKNNNAYPRGTTFFIRYKPLRR